MLMDRDNHGMSDQKLSDGIVALTPLRPDEARTHLAGEDEQLVRWLTGGPGTLEGVETYIAHCCEQWETGGALRAFGIRFGAEGVLAGTVDLRFEGEGLEAGQVNVAYGVYPLWRGRGLAARAVDLVCLYAAGQRATCAVIKVEPENPASGRVARKAGFTFVGQIREQDGTVYDRYERPLLLGQLGQTVKLVRNVVGPELVGTYLHGSSVLGGLGPASDLDVLAVTQASLDQKQRRTLVEGLLEISGLTPEVRPVELTVVVQSDVRPWRFPPIGDFLWGEWLREDSLAGSVPQPEPIPDLALVLTVLLAGDRPLTGPRPAEVLSPVPHADLLRASVEDVPELLVKLDEDTRNILLTLARIWSTLVTGEIRAKDDAADWALARLPMEHRPVLEHARDLYRTCHYQDETWSEELRSQVRPHVDAVLVRINPLAQRALGR